MILYFSATGNSKYVATRIAEALGLKAMSIQAVESDCLNDVRGIVTPTYAFGLPVIVEDFLKLHKLHKHSDGIFFIATYGSTAGQCDYYANEGLKVGSQISFDAYFGVKMPDNWTPMFDLSDPVKVAKMNEAVEPQVDEIINFIKNNKAGNYIKNKLPAIVRIAHKTYYNLMRKTSNFTVEDSCIGCGLCEKKCPAHVIKMENAKPVWTQDRCIMCLGCLHRCPKFAIQYGKNTSKHGQYMNPYVKI